MIVGIDPSLTGTGLYAYFGLEREADMLHLPTTTKDGSDTTRQRWIVEQVEGFLDPFADMRVAVFIEHYAMGRMTGKAFTRVELSGMIRYLVGVLYGFDYYPVPPTTLKSWAAGNGRMPDLVECCNTRWGTSFTAKQHDLADACALARLGAAKLWHGEKLSIERVRGA